MNLRSRTVVAVALACAPLALSACGGQNGEAADSDSTLQYVPTTNYVLQEPATTTTTTTTLPSSTPEEGARSPGEQTYQIQANDSLSKIASRFDVEMQLICEYNAWSDCINPPHLLLPGDEILIPPNAALVAAGDAATEPASTEEDSIDTADDGATASEGEGCLHTIVQGDNPSRVANEYDITVEELSAANTGNPVWNTFLIGSTLNIPANGDC
jgi:LysM repeat protein